MKFPQRLILLVFFCFPLIGLWAQTNSYQITGIITDEVTNTPLEGTTILVSELNRGATTDDQGIFIIKNLTPNTYSLKINYLGKGEQTVNVVITNKNIQLNLRLSDQNNAIETITVTDNRDERYGIQRLRQVEDDAIYASKKNELIPIEKMTVNKAANNSRQIYAKVSGLNIWESDGAGIQLGIGGRGLSPSRNANFNTRQNGYDISADALGYPESYYTPPVEAIQRIELIRGAASLQYGTQFGGMLNFKFKEGPKDKKLELQTRQTIGSFGFYNAFNSVGGTIGKVNYYGFYQYKHSDGWRPNSGINQHTGYFSAQIQVTDNLEIRPEYTHTNYLAQQPGGLTDAEFAMDPRQSKRARNWFAVDWNLFALNFRYQATEKWRFTSQFFGLLGGRDALGNLGNIIIFDDPESPRDFLSDDFNNWGNETRALFQYTTNGNPSTLLVGGRYYQGKTLRRQGLGDTGSAANFRYNSPEDLEGSDFDLPSQNVSFFAENIFNLHPQWSITPGFRTEWIRTKADGYYTTIVRDLANNIISRTRTEEIKQNQRNFVFFGLGSSFKLNDHTEFYTNFSQNYRAINFNDIRVSVGNLVVDESLSDERGFNLDLGARGRIQNFLDYDISLFNLHYKDRIGSVLREVPNDMFGGLVNKIIRFRTNIGDAQIFGFESLLELHLLKLLKRETPDLAISIFTNLSLTNATYRTPNEPNIDGNDVELVPPFLFKTGINLQWKAFKFAGQYSYTAQHFSDASNAVFSPIAIEGIIPSYPIFDLSLGYQWKRLSIESGINNVANAAYFTRRATGYPGPGILPSQGRSGYLTIGYRLF